MSVCGCSAVGMSMPFVVAVGALEADIARGGVGADALKERAQRRAAPFADHAPAFDADVAGDLAGLRQRIELIDRPRPLVIDPAGKLQAIVGRIEARRLLRAVPGVVTEILYRHRFGKSWRQTLRGEHRRLHRVVPRGEAREHALYLVMIAQVAAGEQRQRAERERPAQCLRRTSVIAPPPM